MRYIIGIDLGTTNSCVAYVDTEQNPHTISPFQIDQLVAPGRVQSSPTLPSFCYLTNPTEWPTTTLDLPWEQQSHFFVGHFAQEQGAKTPTRLVQSAKSWLCHQGANRRDRILPIECEETTKRISPVEATTRYLQHIKSAWNHSFAQKDPAALFEEQEIVLTVPASFDEIARMLTVEAAKAAGFQNLTLLEEPQAAFYSWIAQHETRWEKILKAGDTILVCDVGGGTTDFSLIDVTEKNGKLSMQRMAVGDHLLLGGDNIDSALAYHLENKMQKEFTSSQWLQLRHQARLAKETLLNGKSDRTTVLIQGSGSHVIQGSVTVEVTREEIEQLLLNGFFTSHEWSTAYQIRKARGLRTMGLPYEDDPSITKQLAAFLHKNKSEMNGKQPSHLLFNGGTMKAAIFRKAITDAIKKWFPDTSVHVLDSIDLDLAVSRGAAYYGKARRGIGVRIGGGAARSYYLGIDVLNPQGHTEIKALTLLPRGSEEGIKYESQQAFLLTPNTPVSFRLYSSHVRLHDQAGDLIEIDANELHALPPIHTLLRFGKQQFTETEKIPVKLEIALSAIGTIEVGLHAQKSPHRWTLEFQLRNAAGQEDQLLAIDKGRSDETFDTRYVQEGQKILLSLFSETATITPKQLMEHLEICFERPRRDWPLSLLRPLADTLLQISPQRKRSREHEMRWWNTLGFCLRPGFGYPLDDFRCKEFWKIILSELKTTASSEQQIQKWICYRRIAGGLNKGQQTQLASELLPQVLNPKNGKIEVRGKTDLYQYAEKIRVLGALELIDLSTKTKVGNALILRIQQGEASGADVWALGRLGARHLLHGSFLHVVCRDTCEKWIQLLLKASSIPKDQQLFLMSQLARKTDQRDLNISQAVIDQILSHYKDVESAERLQTLLQEDISLTGSEEERLFGDQLPPGLMLHS
ncbi:MAG: Hsp70 family protein [Parachlamydiaceae bacterium]|nr:Hsp70 family protein [Parachlamydiaceae bacterium]